MRKHFSKGRKGIAVGYGSGLAMDAPGHDYGDRYRVDLDKLEGKRHRETRHTGRDDRATTEQVLDPRTRLMLFKLMSTGVLTEINGCVSTGKEVGCICLRCYHCARV